MINRYYLIFVLFLPLNTAEKVPLNPSCQNICCPLFQSDTFKTSFVKPFFFRGERGEVLILITFYFEICQSTVFISMQFMYRNQFLN